MLFSMCKLDFVIIQDPPCVPVLSTLVILGKLKRTKIIVDFHNYGFTILQLNLKNRLILWFAKKYEMIFGRWADYHLCVSNEMKKDL